MGIPGPVGLGWMVLKTNWGSAELDVGPTTEALGQMLLTKYLVPFEMASILLLAALIGAMRLARHFRGEQS